MRRREFAIGVLAATVAGPASALALQSGVPLVGFLNSTSPEAATPNLAAFKQGLRDAGFEDGRNVAIQYRWAEGHYDRLPALAAELAAAKVDVIAASGGDRSAMAAKNATSAIPIVAVIGGDPVAEGLVAGLAHPGGNLTGVSFLTAQLMPKRLELLYELVGRLSLTGTLVNPGNPQTEGVVADMRAAAKAKGVDLRVLSAASEAEIDAVFARIDDLHLGALVVHADPFFIARRDQLIALTMRHALPAIYEARLFPAAGGLISYGTPLTAVYREVGKYAGRVLKGSKAADLPVMQPTEFELVINLKTVKALGLTVPTPLLVAATEVIE
jgi:putative ABC transport system substrate-binding protein